MRKIILISIIGVILFNSCKKGVVGDCFLSGGNFTVEERTISDFNCILLKDNVNLILTKSAEQSIRVEAGSNLLPGIKTTVDNSGKLKVQNDNQCNWIRNYDSPINVYLNYIDIDSIEYRSIGNISTTNLLQTDSLYINVHEGAGEIKLNISVDRLYCSLHYGTADIILYGLSEVSYVYSASFGLINLIDLESTFVFMNNRSSNDVYVNVVHQLGATIENVGNIYYTGNPDLVTIDGPGPGQLIKLP